ncbi:protease complex subunit PrcB family protein [Kovacikia minuta CCNUW1]|uniref:protease complex subunit PrcB family protein n=1 Tax=Kovacikia minuta TaxID=2931930 RepID=UPI001CCC9AD7|nr:protease complex subunit PrcB family protein [Kovacikia minuta]UBF23797.1 protease complex subunit PrcB family protein [Kovacikia minuta CCNUW1]
MSDQHPVHPVIASLLLSLTVAIASLYSTTQPSSDSPLAFQSSSSYKVVTMNSSIRFKVLNFGSTPLEEGFEPNPKAFVYQDQESWTKFWQRTTRLDANLQKPPAPKVDFTHQTIIGLTSGSQRTGGYSVRVDGVELKQGEGGDRWVIHYSEIAPDKSCLVTQEPSTPTVFVSIPKSPLPVELKGQRVTSSC